MFRASLILTTAAIASGSNIRGELSSLANLPKAHARLTIENFNHQRVNPSSLSYHLFTDERGEESDINNGTYPRGTGVGDQDGHSFDFRGVAFSR